MTFDAPAFARLCGDVDTFAGRHWEREPMHRHGDDFSDLFDIAAADRLLGAGALQVPTRVRLSRLAPTISDWEEHCRWIDSPMGKAVPVLDPDAALGEYRRGRTIIFHALRERVPALDVFAGAIEGEIGHPVSVDAFVTPPRSQCWEPHYDTGELFVVQIHGTKQWALWEPTVAVPLPSHCPDQDAASGEAQVVTLEVGDVLYVPRGHPHAASTGCEPSVHLTVSIDPVTWRDAVRMMLGSLRRFPELREALPVGYPSDPGLLGSGTTRTLAHLASTLAGMDAAESAETIAATFAPRRFTRIGGLAEALGDAGPSGRIEP